MKLPAVRLGGQGIQAKANNRIFLPISNAGHLPPVITAQETVLQLTETQILLFCHSRAEPAPVQTGAGIQKANLSN